MPTATGTNGRKPECRHTRRERSREATGETGNRRETVTPSQKEKLYLQLNFSCLERHGPFASGGKINCRVFVGAIPKKCVDISISCNV